ncbi:hypothetical protein [Inediibacterium massiliense]|uniref:hypothetical protein n=1 Tax=Inediibacterium massiliense TaxID=1658111 RepID=UPI0006B664EF|nr:hypothetical protein [Inediibacterium massiliense]
MKSKLIKKIVCTSLVGIITVCGMTACSSNEKEKEVVVLNNQQDEINDVLSIKKIDEIDNFTGEAWLDNGKILGIKNFSISHENKKIPNIAIYDTNSGELQTLSKNEDSGKTLLSTRDITKDERYVLYTKRFDWYSWDDSRNVYVIDLKTGEEKKIAEKVNTASGFLDENKIICSKGMELSIYDVDGNEEKVKLPDKLVENLNDFNEYSFEKYLKLYYDGESLDDKELKEAKERYQYEKENNSIRFPSKKGDEILLETYTRAPFVYNLKTKEYKVPTKTEAKKFYYHRDKPHTAKLEENASGERELWELDENGKHKKIIAKGDIRGSVQVSPDKTKVAYRVYGEKGEKNMFVYDFETEKSFKIFSQCVSEAYWDKDSNQFFMTSYKESDKGSQNPHDSYVTSVVTLN